MSARDEAPKEAQVERVPICDAGALRARYVRASKPVVLTGATEGWPAMHRWSLEGLEERFGERVVTVGRVRDGRLAVSDEHGIEQLEMTLARYLAGLREGVRDYYLITPVEERLPELLDDLVLPELVRAAAWRSVRLWLGAAGTVSPLHRDFPENLYVQVSGRKRVTLIAPRHRRRVYSRGILSGAPNFSRADLEAPDDVRFPLLRDVPRLVCELGPGELLLIPHLWWHHVRTLEVGASVNLWFADGLRAWLGWGLQAYARVRGLRR